MLSNTVKCIILQMIQILHFNSSSRLANSEMKHLSVRLNSSKSSRNVQKTALVIFKRKRKILEHEKRIKLNRNRLYLLTLYPGVKYLRMKIVENLNWCHHIKDLAAKLNITNTLLFQIRNYANQKILGSIYFAIFDSDLN